MFDISWFGHSAWPRLTFHRMGVYSRPAHLLFRKLNVTLSMNTVGGHMLQLGHLGQDLHILKIDIEGGEWKVLEELVTSPLLDYVGQIVIELHLDEIIHLDHTRALHLLQHRAALLVKLEARGFVLAAYWDNQHTSNIFTLPSGSSVHTCGEGLYVNTKWINSQTHTTTVDALIHHYQSQPPPSLMQAELIGEAPPFD
ncbi:probable methyltransferase-like protein 24 [Cherax quadricarinatus]|uniref:probable methyltransferase-like protein 24 n=1 Tax=Cherax quadricarinatus TaxID=27406 RepID=UPI00387E4994